MSFTFVDLFAGIGGFHSALSSRGGECVLASEIDKSASEIYARNWITNNRKFEIDGDIRTLTEGPKILIPKHDVLTGGFPCQPFSKSGSQLGVNEARGTLFFNILRVIQARKPKLVLLENVRNLVGPKHYEDYLIMVKLLRELGYAVSETPTIVSPHEIELHKGGTPQHRQRVFIGAVYVGNRRSDSLKDLPPLISRESLKESAQKWDLRKYLEEFNSESFDSKNDLAITTQQSEVIHMWEDFLETYRRNNLKNPPGLPIWTDYWGSRRSIRIPRATPEWKRQFILRNIELFEKNDDWIIPWIRRHGLERFTPSQRKFEWQAGDSKSIFDCIIQFRPSGVRVKAASYVPTFVAMAQTPVLGWELRELSVEEAALLQGFPKGFDFNNQRRALSLKQIGNAVHPGVANLVFESLVQRAIDLNMPWAKDFIS